MPENGQRAVYYAGREELEEAIKQRFWLGAENTEKSRPARQPGGAQKYSSPSKQDAQLINRSNFSKKQQDTPPASPDGR